MMWFVCPDLRKYNFDNVDCRDLLSFFQFCVCVCVLMVDFNKSNNSRKEKGRNVFIFSYIFNHIYYLIEKRFLFGCLVYQVNQMWLIGFS